MATAPQPNSAPLVHHIPLKEPPTQALVTIDAPAPAALALQQAPDVVLAEAARAARALQQIIESKPRKVVLNGKTFLQFEDWQTLGRFYGVTVIGREAKYVEYGEGRNVTRGFEARAEALLVSTNQVISSASAMCLDDESNWSDKPLFQLKSMAQTRAGAKALRNVLAWVVVLAGYAPTPAEEMESKAPARTAATRFTAGDGSTSVQKKCAMIANSPTLDELWKRYSAAYREAVTAKDRAAMTAYIAAKDARKKELR